MAYIELISRTENTLTCHVAGLPDEVVALNWYIGPDWNGTYNGHGSADANWTFSKVEHPERPGTGYDMEDSTVFVVKFAAFDAYGVRRDDLQPPLGAAFATSWVWNSSLSSWSELGFPAAEFNRFIDLVFAVAEAKRSSKESEIYLPDTAAAYYVTAGTDMQADQLNAVRLLVRTLGTTVPDAAIVGGRITTAFFNGLVDSLYNIV